MIIPAYWFVVVTMTTVGYGDLYPTTAPGYAITVVVMLFGLILTALPVAIIGGNFAVVYEYNVKRKHSLNKRDITPNDCSNSHIKTASVQPLEATDLV